MLIDLEIRNLRIIEHALLQCDPGRNVITGSNGSGKTTLIEAIALAATGRSFRTRTGAPLVRFGTEEAGLRAHFTLSSQTIEERRVHCRLGQREFLAEGSPVLTQDAARATPILVLTSDLIAGIARSAQDRRRFWFWLMFHVEPRFGDLWSRFRRALHQRNAALAGKDPALAAWDTPLIELGEALLDQLATVLDQWSALWPRFAQALGLGTLEATLYRGFDGLSFRDALSAHRLIDRRRGFTGVGPHRADFVFRLNGHPLATFASQGQIKLAAATLFAAQAELIHRQRGALMGAVDDLPAALDRDHAGSLWELLGDIPAQWFITTQAGDWAGPRGKRFHVEQGRVRADA